MADRHKVKREESGKRRRKTRSGAATASVNGHEATSRRAYDVFERRGREHGRDLERIGYKQNGKYAAQDINHQMVDGAEC